MPGPLTGVRVVDCSTGTAGPRATGMLADYGAEVIWIERPGGDRFRPALQAEYSVFCRGKGSRVLDLDRQADRDRLLGLLEGADVFVESWRPGVADRLGLGYDSLHQRLPHLVYCSVSGFGQDGPHRDVPGYEALVHAIVGTMGEQPGQRPAPIFEGLPFASIGAGYLAAIAVAGALYRRRDDGIGRWVETSLLDGALAYLTMLWGDGDVPPPPRDPGSRRLIARNFECADGETIGVHTGAVGGFNRLMALLGLDDRVPPSETGLDMGVRLTPEQRTLLDEQLPEIFASRPRSEWLERLTDVDVCAIPLLHAEEIFDEPQVRFNRAVIRIEDAALGEVEQVGPAIRFSVSEVAVGTRAPLPGEHDEGGWVGADGARPAVGAGGDTEEDRPLLDGLCVLEFGAYYAGPYGSRVLADLGADVIRVETLLGDPNRGSEVIFRNSHAGMRSIAVDLKQPAGREVARKLMAWADVVHHSMRPGAAERLGIGYDDAKAVNPEVVYAYGPGWGSGGPMAQRQSFAPLMSGYVGVAYEVAGQFNPPVYPVGNEDPGNGLLGALGMLMALIHRGRTGQGQQLEHPQLNAAMAHVAHIVRTAHGAAVGAMRLDPAQVGFGPLERLYSTADGWICVVVTSDREAGALRKTLGIDFAAPWAEPLADAGAWRGGDALGSLLEQAIAARTTADLLSELSAAGVPAAEPTPYNNPGFLRDPENLRTGRVGECPHEVRGRVREIARLVRANHATPVPHRLAPALGEHTEEILGLLGYQPEQVAELRELGTIL